MNSCIFNFNWELLGTWAGAIGSIITGSVAARLAWNQNKINKQQSNQEIINIYMQHYAKLMGFYWELNAVELLDNLLNVESIDDKKKLYTNFRHKLLLKSPQLKMIISEVNLFESDEIIGVNMELFSRFDDLLAAMLFNKPQAEIYSLLIKVYDGDMAKETTNKYKQAIALLRKI